MSEAKTVSTRHIYMDVVRIVGCILVMCLHMATLDLADFSIDGIEWKVMNTMDSIGMTGISFFFMISGALFLNKDRELSLKYVWKKIGILFLVYVISLFCYNIIPFLRGWEPWEWYYIKADLIGNIAKGTGIYHLGFLPSLIVLYALAPILKDAFAEKKNCEYFLILFAVFGATIPLLLRFDFEQKAFLESFQSRFGQSWLVGHIGYFVLGHYLHEFAGKLSRKKSIVAALIAIATMVFTISVNHKDAVAKNGFSTLGNSPLTLTGFLFALCVYMLIKTWIPDGKSVKGGKVLQYISSLTFGIYLVHPFVMSTIVPLVPWNDLFGIFVLKVVLRFAFVFVVSALITAVLKCIPLIKRLL